MRNTCDVVRRNSDQDQGHYSDPPLLVLASLADGPKHGYGMIEDIFQMCGTRLGPGTLYGALKRLLEEGLVEEAAAPPKGDASDPRRRYYRITIKGRRQLEAETRRLKTVLSVARLKQVL